MNNYLQQIVRKTKELRRQHRRTQVPRQSILDRAREGRIDVCYRQFACRPCVNVWWRKTPERKQVCKTLWQAMWTLIQCVKV